MARSRLAVLCAALILSMRAAAAPAPPAATPAPPPCSAAEYRQFDFWLGDWNVYGPDGRLAGTNDVTREFDGCVLQEHWVAAGSPPQRGSSFNTWSAATRRWHQTWVDSTGGFLLLDGALKDGAMVLQGERPGRAGELVQHRITWSVLDGGRVRQLWESSRDDGKAWTVVFDGTYVRKK
jgi:hypothetical protein